MDPREHPFSRSYGVILPSSLTRVLPRTLGFSPRLPVSVCGTGTSHLARGFSWQCRIGDFGTNGPSPSRLRLIARRICLSGGLTAWTGYSSSLLALPSCVPPLLFRLSSFQGTRLLPCAHFFAVLRRGIQLPCPCLQTQAQDCF
ncbi:hypothetical protein DV712_11155 [Parageobacillus thermoglucosidasius]|nr:hypothetical protein DV712_11155 [Parageobacillus thermoglucosidasius]